MLRSLSDKLTQCITQCITSFYHLYFRFKEGLNAIGLLGDLVAAFEKLFCKALISSLRQTLWGCLSQNSLCQGAPTKKDKRQGHLRSGGTGFWRLRVKHSSSQETKQYKNKYVYVNIVNFSIDWYSNFFWTGGDAAPISPSHMLILATGLNRVLVTGFPNQPELTFLHEDDGSAVFPTANTCSLVLIPVKNTYEALKYAMETGLANSD